MSLFLRSEMLSRAETAVGVPTGGSILRGFNDH